MNAVDIFAANECIKHNRNSSSDSNNEDEMDHSVGFVFLLFIIFIGLVVAGCTFDEQHPKAYTMTTVDILPYAHRSSNYEGDGRLIVSNGKKEVQLYVHHIDRYKLYEKQTWILSFMDYYNPQFYIILFTLSAMLSFFLSCFILLIYSKCCDKHIKNNS